jgi:glycosyltransferase involved in cell wall biosynthesis
VRLSATVIAQDEERDLPACLESLKFCDEILVVDGGSKDRTREVARSAGARVLERPFDDFAQQHEFARQQAQGEWILSIDADERATPLGKFDEQCAAYSLPFKNHFRGIWLAHGGWWPDRHVRLYKRDLCKYDLRKQVHEKLIVDGAVGKLDSPILHYTYDSLNDCLRKMQRYGDRAARMLHAQGERGSMAKIAFKPLWRFVRGYFLQAGFLDGGAGAAMAWAKAFEAYCRQTRLWELSRFPASSDREAPWP